MVVRWTATLFSDCLINDMQLRAVFVLSGVANVFMSFTHIQSVLCVNAGAPLVARCVCHQLVDNFVIMIHQKLFCNTHHDDYKPNTPYVFIQTNTTYAFVTTRLAAGTPWSSRTLCIALGKLLAINTISQYKLVSFIVR